MGESLTLSGTMKLATREEAIAAVALDLSHLIQNKAMSEDDLTIEVYIPFITNLSLLLLDIDGVATEKVSLVAKLFPEEAILDLTKFVGPHVTDPEALEAHIQEQLYMKFEYAWDLLSLDD